MYTRVLIAYDGSESATDVLEQALTLARSEKAAVDIVTIIPGYQGDLRILGANQVLYEMQMYYRACLDMAVHKALDYGIQAKAHLRAGEPQEEIANLAEDIDADLIAIGKRTHFLIDALPLGFVADEIIRNSIPDVLVCTTGKKFDLDRIFLAYDTTPNSEKAARKASTLAANYGSHLTIGMIYELPVGATTFASHFEEQVVEAARRTMDTTEAMARGMGVTQVSTFIRRGHPVAKILAEEAVAANAGLLVTGRSGGALRIVSSGCARRLVTLSPCPVIIVKRGNSLPSA